MLPHQIDKLRTQLLIIMVQPTAAIEYLVLLQHGESAPDRGRVSEHEDLPSLLGGASPNELLEPIDLSSIHCHFVRYEFGIAKDRGAHPHQQRPLRHLPAKVRRVLSVHFQVRREVLLVRVELSQSLQIVVTPHDVVRNGEPVAGGEASQEVRRDLVATRGAREQFRIVLGVVIAIFGMAQIAQRDHGARRADGRGLVENGLEVRPSDEDVVRVAGVDVQVADHSHGVIVTGGCGGGGGGGGGDGAIAKTADGGARSEGGEGRRGG
mmetsp:Transcript_27173/g.57700  ORF Transcript_27173/g.57700 Transcript_27173/m.57700 type:complete len:266 (-) Transcript_27173:62-859(-)